MKRSTLASLVSIVVLGFVMAIPVTVLAVSASDTVSAKAVKVTMEQARKIALKKVAGEIEDEYEVEDDDGEITGWVFIIKTKESKIFEVEVEAKDGKVVRSEEQKDDEDEDEDDDPGINATR